MYWKTWVVRSLHHTISGPNWQVLIAFSDLCRTLLDQTALLIPNLTVRRRVLSEDDFLRQIVQVENQEVL